MLAHSLAKYFLSLYLLVICFPNNLPASVVEAWARDLSCNLVSV